MPETGKPRILLLCDRRGWAFDTTARSLARHLGAEFSFDLRYVAEEPFLDPQAYDLLYVFFWGERYHRKFLSDPGRVVKVVSSHRWEVEESFGRHTPEEAVERYMHDAGHLLTTSRRLYRAFRDRHPHVLYCPNGVDTGRFRRERERSGPLRIGWAGNVEDRQKGVADILLPASDGLFEIALAGGELPGERMGGFYNSLDVFCVASVAEGEPLTLIEAMACGCFPVCTDVGVVPELVESGKNGLVVERSPEAFREAFGWCRDNLETVREAGRANAALIRERRSWEAVSGPCAAALREILREGKERSPGRAVAAGSGGEDYRKHFDRMNPGGASDATYHATSLYYREEIESLLPDRKEARILEVGTGHGQMLRFLLEKGYVRITGIDRSAGLLEVVRAHYGHRVERLEVADAGEFLPRREGKYDCILMLDLIEHLEEPEAVSVLGAARAALAPGGRLILRTPNMANLLGNYSLHMDLTHRRGYTEWSLLQMLEQCGFPAPQVFVPTEFTMRRRRQFARLNRVLHEALYRLNDRVPPKWYGKNIVVWADREAAPG